LNHAAFDLELGVENDLHEFPEAGGIVVANGFGISWKVDSTTTMFCVTPACSFSGTFRKQLEAQ